MLEHGQKIELNDGWLNYSPEKYGDSRVDIADGLVNLSGVVVSNGLAGSIIGRLPVGLCPAQRLIFPAHYSADTLRVDVLPDGGILPLTFSRKTFGIVNLSNIRFTIDAGEPLALQPGWVAFGGEFDYRPPSALVTDGRVVDLSGIARNVDEGGEVIAVLPEKMRPRRNLVFNATVTGGSSVRVDVSSDGRIVFPPAAGESSDRLVSLSGIRYSLADGERLELRQGEAEDYGGVFGEVTYNHADGVVRLAGLARIHRSFYIADLPDGARPAQTRSFGVRNQDRVVSVEVKRNGQVDLAIGGVDWVSLTGIEYALPLMGSPGVHAEPSLRDSRPTPKAIRRPQRRAERA